ncbi:hypothetical protein J8I87_01285 [Paraburkholderia sp. LEh10]|nr:hypothetical protein [Paraburkholderia sp. LEh10]
MITDPVDEAYVSDALSQAHIVKAIVSAVRAYASTQHQAAMPRDDT